MDEATVSMNISDGVMILAVIAGPILAVQIQKYLEKSSDSIRRKEVIFKTLMATRATPLSIEHVQALNMIDVEFAGKKYRTTVDAWRLYHDNLSNVKATDDASHEKRQDLFISLLKAMGISLGYDFDDVMLRRTAYSPVGHGELESDQREIRKGLAAVLSGKSDFPIFITNELNQLEKDDQHKAPDQVN